MLHERGYWSTTTVTVSDTISKHFLIFACKHKRCSNQLRVNNKKKTKMYLIIEWILFCLHSDCACSGAFILRFTKNFNTVSRIFKCICVYLLAVIFVLFIMEIKLNKQCIKSVEIDCAALMLLVEISILGKVVNENWWSVCTMHSAMQWVLNFLTHAIHMMS